MEDGTSQSVRNICGTEVSCEVRQILDRIGDKWSLLVMALLARGTLRFTELRRQIDGISQRMLTLTLRQLERDGLVERTVHAVVPPRVDYNLSALGRTLLDPINGLVQWTIDHHGEVAAARQAYDDRPAPAAQS
ncbi:MAG TPA: helix-turn-helix domain-containing protein [Acidimicrobiales bacterium]|nr:helix-turn-helix domain-containing protein [Acidimicrobiales bacterium]